MFGYVRPALDRLDEAQRETFCDAYCGLCHALGQRYGLPGRMILNYDLTFLAMLLSAGGGTTACRRCMLHPLKPRRCVCGDAAFDAAADMSVILTWWQLRDGVEDSSWWKGLKDRFASLFLRRAYRKAQRCRPAFDAGTRRQLSELSELEQTQSSSLDAPADTFARLLSCAAAEVDDPVRRRILEQLLYHLGRWIYLVDAADDLKKDVRSHSYNPLPLRYGFDSDTLDTPAKEALSQTLDSSVRAMAAAFELTDFGSYTAIIESTVYQGLYAVGYAVLNGTFRRRTKSSRKKGGMSHA